ncbi:E1-E2 ATPase-domain-containing protein [Rhexocercosporidium sp. MPI-PUGE-AT-0058]|nr:E1-E2 ATPase-domain-containing protein [Rhexocercosporidium sp. MPI-PUGE-AT-0058]
MRLMRDSCNKEMYLQCYLYDSSIATDETAISGISDVDEFMITDEATLVTKQPGSLVVAGSINHSGTLTIRLTRVMGDNTIKAIGLMVDEAKSSKAKFQNIADRVGVGKGIRDYPTTTACINAMTYAIAALIVSCPCAIGLAVPMILVIAGGVAAKNGVIFKLAETIEKARLEISPMSGSTRQALAHRGYSRWRERDTQLAKEPHLV